MYNHNKAQQSKNRVHISWDILYIIESIWWMPIAWYLFVTRVSAAMILVSGRLISNMSQCNAIQIGGATIGLRAYTSDKTKVN